jgi:cytochrome oxidase Cu insertion factor (SCO1/SenC/PrrC family)
MEGYSDMKRSVSILLGIAVVLTVIFLISCAPSSPAKPVAEPPPAPAGDSGEQYRKAPDFEAIDSRGKSIKLSDYIGKKNLVIVVNRGFG